MRAQLAVGVMNAQTSVLKKCYSLSARANYTLLPCGFNKLGVVYECFMKLIVGLGNPGEKYENTRHNLGFRVVDHVLQHLSSDEKSIWNIEKKLKSHIALSEFKKKNGESEKVILVKPQTFMNLSGEAVQLVVAYYKIAPEDTWIVYDELDLPVGFLKIRFGGAAAGHHGVESIIEKLSTDKFWRFRLGIGASRARSGRIAHEDGEVHAMGRQEIHDAENFVIGSFEQGEQGKVRELIKHASKAIEYALEKDLDAAMNRFNTK